jgi:hypothetical protein
VSTPDEMNQESSTPDEMNQESSAPDEMNQESSAPDDMTQVSSAPDDMTQVSSAPDDLSLGNDAAAQTELTMSEIESLYTDAFRRCKHRYNAEDQAKASFSRNAFAHDDNRTNYYTGLPNFKVMEHIFSFVREHVPVGKSLDQFQEYAVVLTKLRLNLGMQDLAYRVGVSVSTISRVINKWLCSLNDRLSSACMIWPDRESLCETMPLCFRKSFGNKVTVIIDCFEIFIDKPSNVLARAETWSQYKHHNTVKFLIGIAPQGVVTFISAGWGGRVSDKFIAEHCGLLDKLLPGDVVLADRGFTISDSISVKQAKLNLPAFTKGRDQLTALEVEESRNVSNVRIQVERVIGSVRQKFQILGGPLPLDFVAKKAGDTMPLIDRVVRVCCCLHNCCPSIVPFN